MRNKIILLIIAFFMITYENNGQSINANNTKPVEVTGVGISRDDALQDALRAAVGKAVGVYVTSETTVENFMVVKDAVSTNSRGYIKSYEVLKEIPFPDRHEVTIKALVSLDPLEADVQMLTNQIGGVRFLVIYDDRKVNDNEKDLYNYTVEKVNNYLASNNYRYIENTRYKELRREASNIMQDTDTSSLTYVQQLGLLAGAEFIIYISKIHINSRSEAFDTRTASQIIVEIKTYDNCTAEGLGTVMLKSEWNSSPDKKASQIQGIDQAIKKDLKLLMASFNNYIGNWVNSGIPYELRFYQVGTFRDFRTLRTKIRNDEHFGGQFNITSVNNYTKLNITYKMLPDQLAFQMLDFADQIPAMQEKVLDVLLIYGRQISFAPQNVVVPELNKAKQVMEK